MTGEARQNRTVGAVVIGRNEGERLVQCLNALSGKVARLIYVDSGSTDDSVAKAREIGAEVVELDMSVPFTAARARNAGVASLEKNAGITFVQFVDGDCTLRPDWLAVATTFLADHPAAAAVCGRLREKAPEATLWNRLADEEWAGGDSGQVKACGGIAMMRLAALTDVQGFDQRLIAGEEPELCLRLRAQGWTIWRLDAEMALHDADMTSFHQWWQRSRRAGYTYAEGVAMHGAPPERHNVTKLRRSLLWGAVLPLGAVLGAVVSPWALLLLLAWPLQVFRLVRKGMSLSSCAFLMLAKIAEAQGAAIWAWRRFLRREAHLIEYK